MTARKTTRIRIRIRIRTRIRTRTRTENRIPETVSRQLLKSIRLNLLTDRQPHRKMVRTEVQGNRS